jgi:tryptophan halogenase
MNVNNIVVVGGGSSGWMTAATLIKAFPTKNITVIESKDVPIVGVGESTLGGIRHWTKFIGLDEDSFFKYTDASYKLSIKFTDFYKKDSGSFHYPFGAPFMIADRNHFLDWHLKKYYYPDTTIQDFTQCLIPASALYENNKYSENLNNEFDNFNPKYDVAYHFDAVKFGGWLREKYCLPRGVKHIAGTVVKFVPSKEGIEKLILDNGEEVTADLFVDCTGFRSLMLSETLKEPFQSYNDIIPNNKAWATRIPYKDRSKELEGYTNCTARENGWCWNIPLWSRLGTGYVYSDKYVTKEQALEEFKQYLMSDRMVIPRTRDEVEGLEFREITMRVGIHNRTFVKNVVAIGLAAGFIEPLESNGLFSVHEFLFKLVDVLQRGQISQFDRDMYNTSVKDMFDSFAKFVALHYALSHRNDTEYWRNIQQTTYADDRENPNSICSIRTGAFHNMGWRYMNEWGFATDRAGLPFIATGMNISMVNEHRAQSIDQTYGRNFAEELPQVVSIWEQRKASWNTAAKQCDTLEDYLYKKFYNK